MEGAVPDWIVWRFDRAPRLAELCRVLPAAEARQHHQKAWALSPDPPAVQTLDVAKVDRAEVSRLLRLQAVGGDSEVVVAHGFDPEHAIQMRWKVFVEHWDDLWYPASDDIRVVELDGGAILELHHEEVLRILRRPDVGPSGLLFDWERSQPALARLGAVAYQFGYEPAGSRYADLLRLALRYNLYGAFVMQDFPWAPETAGVVQQFEPWHLMDRELNEWPGTRATNLGHVIVFRFDEGSAALLGRLARRLYQWQQPDLPEDLCLFRGTGEPWLVSIAHEADGWLNLTAEEVQAARESLAPVPLSPPGEGSVPS